MISPRVEKVAGFAFGMAAANASSVCALRSIGVDPQRLSTHAGHA